MNLRNASREQLNQLTRAVFAKMHELGGVRASLAAQGRSGASEIRRRRIDPDLRDLTAAWPFIMAEFRRRMNAGFATWATERGVPQLSVVQPGDSTYRGFTPAGAVYGPASPATPMLGIYEATPARRLLLSRADPQYLPAGYPEITVMSNPPKPVSAGSVVYGLLATASSAASAYHGVKRNNGSIGWGITWGLLGGMFPVLTPAIAVAQGFAKPAK